jgi:hypothetical protein
VNTRRLEEFFGDTIPRYAILSHTWGQEEVTFQDLAREDHKQKHGYKKIEGCCQAAAEQQTGYVWVDTCCIDKSSSAELSEAINSMFKWYEASAVCFIYLRTCRQDWIHFRPSQLFVEVDGGPEAGHFKSYLRHSILSSLILHGNVYSRLKWVRISSRK